MVFLFGIANILNDESQSIESRVSAISKLLQSPVDFIEYQPLFIKWIREREDVDEESVYARLHHIMAQIRLSYSTEFVQFIVQLLMKCNEPNNSYFECFVAATHNERVCQYLASHLDQLAVVIRKLTHMLKTRKFWKDKIEHLIRSTTFIIRKPLDKHLCAIFLQQMAAPYAELALYAQERHCLIDPIEHLFHRVLFTDRSYTETVLRSTTISEQFVSAVIRPMVSAIRALPWLPSIDVAAMSSRLLLSSLCRPTGVAEWIFTMFLTLNESVGVGPLGHSYITNKLTVNLRSIRVCRKLLEVVISFGLDDSLEMEELTVENWVAALLDKLLDSSNILSDDNQSDLAVEYLSLMTMALDYEPHNVNTNWVKRFVKEVMLRKRSQVRDDDLTDLYEQLCKTVCLYHPRRLNKMFEVFMESYEEVVVSETLTVSDIFPSGFIQLIETHAIGVSRADDLLVLSTMTELLRITLVRMKNLTAKELDHKSSLLLDIMSSFLTTYFNSSNLVSRSVPESLKQKYISLLDRFNEILEIYGLTIISKKHMPKVMRPFLQLCLAWGDQQFLMMVFEISPRKVPKQSEVLGKLPTNLAHMHPYLSDHYWNLIAQRVANFGDETCETLLCDLVLQKVKALPLMEDELTGSYIEENEICARYLATSRDSDWLLTNLRHFIDYLRPKELLKVASVMISPIMDGVRITTASGSLHGPVYLCAICVLFERISKKLAKLHMRELKRICRMIDFEKMIAAEVDRDEDTNTKALNGIVEELGAVVTDDLKNEYHSIDFSIVQKEIFVLSRVPATFFNSENRRIVCLFCISLLKHLTSAINDENHETILINVLECLQGSMVRIKVPDSLNLSKVMLLFHRTLKDSEHYDVLITRLYSILREFSVSNLMNEMVDDVSTKKSNANVLELLDLTTSYWIKSEKSRKRKNIDSDIDTYVGLEIKKGCYDTFTKAIASESLSENFYVEHSNSFCMLLRRAITTNNEIQLELLKPFFNKFLERMDEITEQPSERTSLFLWTILKYRSGIESLIPKNFILNTWISSWFLLDDRLVRSFAKFSNITEFREMMQILNVHSEFALKDPEIGNLKCLETVWTNVVRCTLYGSKNLVIKRSLMKLCDLVHPFAVGGSLGNVDIVKTFSSVFTAVNNNKKISLSYRMVDLSFDLISAALTASEGISLLDTAIEALFVFCAARTPLILDRVPTFYGCYRQAFTRVAEASRTSADDMTSCAHKLEKMTNSLVKYKKDFAKTAGSAISDTLKVYAEINIEDNVVQMHLKNATYCWMSMCDPYVFDFLSSTLNPVSEILFTQLRNDYKKYYKYSGKV